MSRAVVITGVGAVTPLGVGARALHERWTAGDSGIRDGVGRCDDFEPDDHMTAKEVRRSDRFTQLALGAGAEALESAGWDGGPPVAAERAASVLGTGISGIATIEEEQTVLLQRGPERVSPSAIPRMMGNAAGAALAIRHGLEGESLTTMSACASGAHAIGIAARAIRHGEADVALAGGSEAPLTPFTIAAFARIDATSTSGVSRPFDRRRDGFVMGEGAGLVVLEAEEVARARGAPVLGRLLGYASTSDAHHLTAPDPSGAGAARAIGRALADADVTPAEVAYVNAHGTSTPLNDRAETLAIKMALGEERAREVPVSSTKSATGHLLGAAGAVEAIATLFALRDRVAQPTLNWAERDEGLDLDYVPNEARPLSEAAGRFVGISNAFGFGGHNVVLCIEADPA